MEKTHWKKIVSDPNYLGEADFNEGEEKALTVAGVNAAELVTTAEGKSKKAVMHWQEAGAKPMILNVVRSKAIEKVTGSPFFEDWPGAKLQLYIDHNVKAFGEIVSAVRVRPYKPRIKLLEPVPPCTDCGGEITGSAGHDAHWMVAYTVKHYGCPLCATCATARKDAAAAEAQQEEARKAAEESATDDVQQSEEEIL